jgi:TonB family protein
MREKQIAMFGEVNAPASKRRALLLSISVTLHLSFLAWLLHGSSPTFLAPSSIVRGERTGSATALYFPSRWGQNKSDAVPSPTDSHPRSPAAQARITWTRSRNIGKSRDREIALSKAVDQRAALASVGGNPAPPLGSPYGSVSQGAVSGFEVRPALWASGSDPLVAPRELNGLEGTVIVEITIDEQGRVVRTAVLQSLAPAIDAKVVAALENWHFHPATRDGVAVASKQDVLYHFPQRR